MRFEPDQRDDDGGNSLILALKKVTHKIVRTNLTVIAELTILPVAGQAGVSIIFKNSSFL